jgi:hypothetical protein
MVVLMNLNDEHALSLCYISGSLIQDHMLNQNMEGPPRKTVQPQGIWLYIGWVIRDSVGMTLPDKGKGER